MTIAERLRQEGHQIGWQEGKIEGWQEEIGGFAERQSRRYA